MSGGADAGWPSSGDRAFTTTHWSVVLAAGQGADPHASAALEQLCRTYWYPLYAYIRRRGHSPADAQDLTQEFFARLLAKNYLSAAHQERGRFRWFLLCAIQRFLVNERERAQAVKRGGVAPHVPFDGAMAEGRYGLEAVDQRTPDKLFDRAWAITLLEAARQRLQEEYTLDGKTTVFEQLSAFLSGDKTGLTYAEAGMAVEMSEGAVKVAVHRMRRRYRELLREQVAQTIGNPAELEDELRQLHAIFSA